MTGTELPDNRRAIARIPRGPRLWGERYLRNRNGSVRRYWPHQTDDLECGARNIIHLDGGSVGKSECLSTLVLLHTFVKGGGSLSERWKKGFQCPHHDARKETG